jgi:hypothetical protein
MSQSEDQIDAGGRILQFQSYFDTEHYSHKDPIDCVLISCGKHHQYYAKTQQSILFVGLVEKTSSTSCLQQDQF